MSEQTLDISWSTIVKFLITGFVLYIFFMVRDILVLFLFALIISLLIEPVINFFRWFRFPKILAAIVSYLLIFGIMGLIICLTAPIFIFELNQFSQNIPQYFEKVNPILSDFGIEVAHNFEDFIAVLVSGLKNSSGNVLHAISTFFGGVLESFLIFTMAFFISVEDRGVERVLAFLAPKRYEESVVALFERAQHKVSRWFGARILSCIFVALTSFIALYLLNIKYAFILALLAGVLNFVPYVGPTVSLALSVLFVGVSDSWMLAVYVFVIFLVIQEIENKALTPILMKKFMDLPPVLVLMSLLVGGTFFGFLGTVFSVPIFGIIYEFSKEFFERKNQSESV